MKKTVQAADQSLFEKDEMALREEKARRDLAEERIRWEEEVRKRDEKTKAEKEKADWEAGSRIGALEEALAAAEAEAIKLQERLKTAEKRKEEEEENRKRKSNEEKDEIDINNLKSIMNHAAKDGKPTAEEAIPSQFDATMELRQLQQTEERLRQEIANYEAKTRSLERDLSEARDECVKLHEKMAEVEREASLARLKRDTMVKFRFDDAKETRENAERKVEEARQMADVWRDKYAEDMEELKV